MKKNKPLFLVIDDDLLNNMICKIVLEMVFGKISVETFTNGEVALDFIKETYSDSDNEATTTILLDINMPIMSGWEFLEAFESLDEHIKNKFKIYLLTSSVDDRDKERAKLNPNIAEFLSKPLTREMVTQIKQHDAELM